MGAFTSHRQFEKDGPRAGESLEEVDGSQWRALGTKEKLFLLKLKEHVTWGQRVAWRASAASVLLLAPGCSGTQVSAEASGSLPSLTPPEDLGAGHRGSGMSARILTGYTAQPPGDHPRTQPTPQGPHADCS